jgi:hypothetical protein
VTVGIEPISRGITVNIRYGDEASASFQGSVEQVLDDIRVFFAIPADAIAGLSLSELVINASALARGLSVVSSALDATAIATPTPDQAATPPASAQPAAANAPASASDPWQQASTPYDEPATPAAHPLLARIEQASSVPELQRLWAENQQAFTDPTVMAAWKTRGRTLA